MRNRVKPDRPISIASMIEVLDVCSGYLDVPSLLCLLCVSSECRQIVSDFTIWQEILRKAGFKRLGNAHRTSSFSIVNALPTIQQHVKTARACELCWKKRAPPIRLKNNNMSALCVSCEGGMLSTRKDINNILNAYTWRPKLRTLFSQLVIAKRRHTRQHLYWKCQVERICRAAQY